MGLLGEVTVLVSRVSPQPGEWEGAWQSRARLQHGARLGPEVWAGLRVGARSSPGLRCAVGRTLQDSGPGDSQDTAALPYQLGFPLGLKEWVPNASRVGPEDKLHITPRWSTPALR